MGLSPAIVAILAIPTWTTGVPVTRMVPGDGKADIGDCGAPQRAYRQV